MRVTGVCRCVAGAARGGDPLPAEQGQVLNSGGAMVAPCLGKSLCGTALLASHPSLQASEMLAEASAERARVTDPQGVKSSSALLLLPEGLLCGKLALFTDCAHAHRAQGDTVALTFPTRKPHSGTTLCIESGSLASSKGSQ